MDLALERTESPSLQSKFKHEFIKLPTPIRRTGTHVYVFILQNEFLKVQRQLIFRTSIVSCQSPPPVIRWINSITNTISSEEGNTVQLPIEKSHPTGAKPLVRFQRSNVDYIDAEELPEPFLYFCIFANYRVKVRGQSLREENAPSVFSLLMLDWEVERISVCHRQVAPVNK